MEDRGIGLECKQLRRVLTSLPSNHNFHKVCDSYTNRIHIYPIQIINERNRNMVKVAGRAFGGTGFFLGYRECQNVIAKLEPTLVS